MLRLDRLIAPVELAPFRRFHADVATGQECPALCAHFFYREINPFNWNNCGSDRIALVDVAPGDIGVLLTQPKAKHKGRRRNIMKHKWARACVVAALSLGLASPTAQAAA